jgi:thymidine kinase
MSVLEVIVGPMGSSKTTYLLGEIDKYSIAEKNILYFCYYQDHVKITHGNQSKRDPIKIKKFSEILSHNVSGVDLIAVDEMQFFGIEETFEEIVYVLNKLMSKTIRILLVGLDCDFSGKPFVIMCSLISQANKVEKKTAICQCCKNINKSAIFSHRLDKSNNLIEIGSSYISLCRECYLKI